MSQYRQKSTKNSISHKPKRQKLEIAFMPYKASMFDSLESIYRVAKDDPDCSVSVVPVPYYDYTPDKQLELCTTNQTSIRQTYQLPTGVLMM